MRGGRRGAEAAAVVARWRQDGGGGAAAAAAANEMAAVVGQLWAVRVRRRAASNVARAVSCLAGPLCRAVPAPCGLLPALPQPRHACTAPVCACMRAPPQHHLPRAARCALTAAALRRLQQTASHSPRAGAFSHTSRALPVASWRRRTCAALPPVSSRPCIPCQSLAPCPHNPNRRLPRATPPPPHRPASHVPAHQPAVKTPDGPPTAKRSHRGCCSLLAVQQALGVSEEGNAVDDDDDECTAERSQPSSSGARARTCATDSTSLRAKGVAAGCWAKRHGKAYFEGGKTTHAIRLPGTRRVAGEIRRNLQGQTRWQVGSRALGEPVQQLTRARSMV